MSQPQPSSCPADILKEFDPTPGHQVMNKVRYFFQPYNCQLGFAKHMEFDDRTNQSLKILIEKTIGSSKLDLNSKQELKDYLSQLEQQEHDQRIKKQWRKVHNQVLQEGSKCFMHFKQSSYKHKSVLLKAAQTKRRKALMVDSYTGKRTYSRKL